MNIFFSDAVKIVFETVMFVNHVAGPHFKIIKNAFDLCL